MQPTASSAMKEQDRRRTYNVTW